MIRKKDNEKTEEHMNKKAGKIIAIVVAVIVVAAVGYLLYDAKQEVSSLKSQVAEKDQKIENFRTNPDAAAEEEVDRYVEEVGKLYALPENEEPSVATVSDKEKLKDQPFFKNAENGDITLIYTQSKIAILYRPSSKQIVNVSTVSISDDNSADSSESSPEPESNN